MKGRGQEAMKDFDFDDSARATRLANANFFREHPSAHALVYNSKSRGAMRLGKSLGPEGPSYRRDSLGSATADLSLRSG
jgi:hypothetical protein